MEQITDLLYCHESEVSEEIRKKFPEVTLESHWDEFHGYRVGVNLHAQKKDWYKFLIEAGLAEISLWFGIDMYNDEGFDIIKSVLYENSGKNEKEITSDLPQK